MAHDILESDCPDAAAVLADYERAGSRFRDRPGPHRTRNHVRRGHTEALFDLAGRWSRVGRSAVIGGCPLRSTRLVDDPPRRISAPTIVGLLRGKFCATWRFPRSASSRC